MDKNDKYRQLYPDLPEAVYDPLKFKQYPEKEMLERAKDWFDECERRRTTRHFSRKTVPQEMIELAIKSFRVELASTIAVIKLLGISL